MRFLFLSNVFYNNKKFYGGSLFHAADETARKFWSVKLSLWKGVVGWRERVDVNNRMFNS